MKDIPVFIGQAETAKSTAVSAPSSAEMSQFEQSWNSALADFGSMLEPDAREGTGPSAFTNIASRQSEILQQSHAALDLDVVKGMSTIQIDQLMAEKQNVLNNARALMDVNWAFLKTARQAVDTVMNSK